MNITPEQSTTIFEPPRAVCYIFQKLHDAILGITNLREPTNADLSSFCEMLDLSSNVPADEVEILKGLSRVRQCLLVFFAFSWVRIRIISTASNLNISQLTKANQETQKAQKQIRKALQSMMDSIDTMKCSPGAWLQVARRHQKIAESLNKLERLLTTNMTTRRRRQAFLSSLQYFILLGTVVSVRGFSLDTQGGNGWFRRMIRRIAGPPLNVSNAMIWRIVCAAESSVNLHPTATTTIYSKFVRRKPMPSFFFDQHVKELK